VPENELGNRARCEERGGTLATLQLDFSSSLEESLSQPCELLSVVSPSHPLLESLVLLLPLLSAGAGSFAGCESYELLLSQPSSVLVSSVDSESQPELPVQP
jgi:hypothetical protein